LTCVLSYNEWRRASVAGLIVVGPGIEVKTIEGDTLVTDGNLGQVGSYFGIEAVAVHAEVKRGVPQPDQAWQKLKRR
jgi:hypothetical protein